MIGIELTTKICTWGITLRVFVITSFQVPIPNHLAMKPGNEERVCVLVPDLQVSLQGGANLQILTYGVHRNQVFRVASGSMHQPLDKLDLVASFDG